MLFVSLRYRVGLLALAALLAACQANVPAPSATNPTPTPAPSTTRTTAPASTRTASLPTSTATFTPTPTLTLTPADRIGLTPNGQALLLADLARADLAARLGIAESATTVLTVDAAELSLPNFGCPSGATDEGPAIPGIVVGFSIQLEANGQTYEYRASGRRVVYCGP